MAGRRALVVDSSVAVKWFTREEKSKEAIELMDAHATGEGELAATELLLCEVANALRHNPGFSTEVLGEAVGQLFRLHLLIAPLDERLLRRAVEIAFDGGVTVYDALPVALAEDVKTVCITADEKIQYGCLKPKGYPVRLL